MAALGPPPGPGDTPHVRIAPPARFNFQLQAPNFPSSHGKRLPWEAAHAAGPWLTRPPLKPNRPHAAGRRAGSEMHADGSRSRGSIAASQASRCRSS